MADITGYFKITALRELDNGEQTGYDLIKSFERVFNKKPSAGSIYPLLNELLKEKLVTVKSEGRKKIYRITQKGKNSLKKICREKEKLMLKGIKMLNLLGVFSNKEDEESFNKFVDLMRSKSDLFLHNIDVWHEIKDCSLRMISSDSYPQKQKKIRLVLEDALKKLKKIEKED